MKIFNITVGNVQLLFHNAPKRVVEFYKRNIYYSNKKGSYLINIYFGVIFPKKYYVVKDKLGNKVALNFSEIGNKRLSIYADKKINLIYLHNLIIEQIIRVLVLQDNMIFLHASSIQVNKKIIVVCGKRKSGKTNFYLGLLKKGCSFISDDLSLVNKKYVLPYKRIVNLFAYNFETYRYLLNKTKLDYRLLFLIVTIGIKFIRLIPISKKLKEKLVNLVYASTNIQIPAGVFSNTVKKPVKINLVLILDEKTKRINKVGISTAIRLISVMLYEDRKEFIDIYRKSKQSSKVVKGMKSKEKEILKKMLKNNVIYVVPKNMKPINVVKELKI